MLQDKKREEKIAESLDDLMCAALWNCGRVYCPHSELSLSKLINARASGKNWSRKFIYFFFSLILAHCQHLREKESKRFEWDDRKAHKLNRSHIWPTLKTIYAWPEPNIKAKSPETFLWLFGFVATSLNPRKLHFSRAQY